MSGIISIVAVTFSNCRLDEVVSSEKLVPRHANLSGH